MWTIRIAGGVGTIALLLALGACGGAGGSTEAASTLPNPPPPDTTAPAVSITTPTASASYSTANATVALGGTAADNVGVTSVTWTNAANNTNGTASLTSPSWSIASVALAPGSNAITVTAHDAAGNIRNATLAVTYNPGGGTSLSGSVDSSLINRSGPNAVYIYNGTVIPGEIGSGTSPLTTASVTQDNNACTFGYQVAGLAAGTYTVAFANQTDNPGANDAIVFKGTAQLTVAAGGGAIHNFLPARPPLQVGPTRMLKLPSAAAAVAVNGDVIEIDAGQGEYLDDIVVWRQSNLILRGVGGARAYMHATQIIPFDPSLGDRGNGKGIWVTSAQNTTVENIEFSGALVPDENGAGIRADGPGLTVCNGYFHDNENGILGGAGIVLIEYSEFNHNGHCPVSGGCSHNMYINEATTRFTLRYSYSHRANQGHTVKSRAQENHILYNRIMDEADGNSSYKIDIPDGGRTFIIGNLLQRGPNAENQNTVAYAAESANNGTLELYVVNNTFVNDGGAQPFVSIRGGTTARVVNNIFAGGGAVPTTGGTITATNNLVSPTTVLVNSAGFDYHLAAGASGAINMGTDPGTAASVSLTPTSQYVHPISRQDRPVNGAIDIGAYEFQ
jgi:hypothetical protein